MTNQAQILGIFFLALSNYVRIGRVWMRLDDEPSPTIELIWFPDAHHTLRYRTDIMSLATSPSIVDEARLFSVKWRFEYETLIREETSKRLPI